MAKSNPGKECHSSEEIFCVSECVYSGFMPVNPTPIRHSTVQDCTYPPVNQRIGEPSKRRQKISAGQEFLPSATKKAKAPSNKLKASKKAPWSATVPPDVSFAISATQSPKVHQVSGELGEKSNLYAVHGRSSGEGVRLSTKTIDKLAAFKYQASNQEGVHISGRNILDRADLKFQELPNKYLPDQPSDRVVTQVQDAIGASRKEHIRNNRDKHILNEQERSDKENFILENEEGHYARIEDSFNSTTSAEVENECTSNVDVGDDGEISVPTSSFLHSPSQSFPKPITTVPTRVGLKSWPEQTECDQNQRHVGTDQTSQEVIEIPQLRELYPNDGPSVAQRRADSGKCDHDMDRMSPAPMDESEDEFPIIDELFDLSQMLGVEESFEPPSSVYIPFEEDHSSQMNEAYDPHLQFSTPPSERLKYVQSGGKSIAGDSFPSSTRQPFSYNDTNSLTQIAEAIFSPPHHASFSCNLTHPTTKVSKASSASPSFHNDSDDFGDEDAHLEVINFDDQIHNNAKENASYLPTPTTPKLQWNAPIEYNSIRTLPVKPNTPIHVLPLTYPSPVSQIPRPKHTPLATPTLPLAPLTYSDPTPHLLTFSAAGTPHRIVRPPFPTPSLSPSLIIGLTASPRILTCFRIGEALRAASHAARTSTTILVELYASVTYSRREGFKQHFQFADLFSGDKPPFLSGEWVGWKGCKVWELDGSVFLGELGDGKVCRCVGRLERKAGQWRMKVLSVWHATWGDVGLVKGVVCG